MKAIALFAVLHAGLLPAAESFQTCARTTRPMALRTSGRTISTLEMSSDSAVSDYLKRASDEKFSAMQELEDKQSKEIAALKEKLQKLKDAATAKASPTGQLSHLQMLEKAELAKKYLEAQKFMAEYVQKLDKEKNEAVQSIQAGRPPADTKAYDERSANVAEAAVKGKSRWGDEEVTKAIQVSKDASSPPPIRVVVPPEVEAADHGLRADGGVGGPSLAERVALGVSLGSPGASVADAVAASSALASPAAPAASVGGDVPPSSDLFNQRNAAVAAAAAAGKSRWDDKENARATEAASKAGATAPAVVASPGNLSIKDRINIGAKLMSG